LTNPHYEEDFITIPNLILTLILVAALAALVREFRLRRALERLLRSLLVRLTGPSFPPNDLRSDPSGHVRHPSSTAVHNGRAGADV
jgi:hypothetical protein